MVRDQEQEDEQRFERAEDIAAPRATISASKDKSFASLAPLTSQEWTQVVDAVIGMNGYSHCQASLNAVLPRNAWIMKPAGKSRGRGISCSSDIAHILDKRGGHSKESHWVVQKYIERPLLLLGRKFDIRQWVLVTSYNPLTVYFFRDCYLRFCAVKFSLDDLGNKYIHLANNSIQKTNKKFKKQEEIPGLMWHSDRFIDYIRDTTGSDKLWYDQVQPQMERIVVGSLQSAQDMVLNRPNSCELYGYDFMIDASWRPWLIEINSSPDFSYSTPVTKKLVKAAAPDIIKVLVDLPAHEKRRRQQRRRGKRSSGSKTAARDDDDTTNNATESAQQEPPDTGGWKLVHKASFTVSRPLSCLTHDFTVRGEPLVPPSTRSIHRLNLGQQQR